MASSLYPIQAHKLASRTKDKGSLRAHGSQDCFKNVFLSDPFNKVSFILTILLMKY